MLLAVSKNGWDSLSQREQNILRAWAERVNLGEPKRMVNKVTAARWYYFLDHRITTDEIAWFGVLTANLPTIAGWPNADKASAKAYLASLRVDPENVEAVESPELGASMEEILRAIGAPLAVRSGAPHDLHVPYDPDTHGVF